MPLVKRSVEPSSLCRQKIPKSVKSELECVTNNTLSGVILQLSSLSSHAEDLFGELFSEASSFYTRASNLQVRIDRLNDKVQSLDSTVEEVALHDINMRKAFRSSGNTDQQVVSRESLSQTLQDTYNRADKPPPLQDLNQYRDDGRDALKIYTDPDYFFNLWREAMQKEMREAKEKRREQRKRERKANPNAHRQERKVREAIPKSKLKAQRMQRGVEFAETVPAKPTKNHVDSTPVNMSSSPNQISNIPVPPPPDYMPPKGDSNGIPNMQPPSPPPAYFDHPAPPSDLPAPPPPPVGGMSDYPGSIPPPPPPMESNIPPPPPSMNSIPPPPPPMSVDPSPPGGAAPPPPPPPPPPSDAAAAPPANIDGMAAQLANVQLSKAKPEQAKPDPRNDLLGAIRLGKNLRKVERPSAEQKKQKNMGNDVASILARRIAFDLSDSESDMDDSDSGGEWSD